MLLIVFMVLIKATVGERLMIAAPSPFAATSLGLWRSLYGTSDLALFVGYMAASVAHFISLKVRTIDTLGP